MSTSADRPRPSLDQVIARIPGASGAGCRALLGRNRARLEVAPGSGHNHQAWPGGYMDHLAEVMNTALVLHEALGALRPLPFSVEDALLVLFCHDLEKPWRYGPDGVRDPALGPKPDKAAFRAALMAEHGIVLSAEQANALRYVEGEGDDYSGSARAMGPLGAFCHMCDVASARLWPEHPLAAGDPWPGAARRRP